MDENLDLLPCVVVVVVVYFGGEKRKELSPNRLITVASLMSIDTGTVHTHDAVDHRLFDDPPQILCFRFAFCAVMGKCCLCQESDDYLARGESIIIKPEVNFSPG